MSIKLFVRSFIVALAAICLTVAVAEAASRVPYVTGATYKGQSGGHYPVKLVVAAKPTRRGGRIYRAALTYCHHTAIVLIVPPTPASHGYHFGERYRVKTIGVPVTLYRIYGAFSSRTEVKGNIDLDFGSGCDGLPAPWYAKLT